MKISITDFGPIKSCEFNMEKSFIGIFGKNNAGKSYSISVVYLILKNIIDIYKDLNLSLRILIDDHIEKFEENLRKSDLLKKRGCNIKNQMEVFLKELLSEIFIDRLSNSFYSTFNDLSNLKNQSSKNYPAIRLTSDVLEVSFIIKKTVILDSVSIKNNVLLRRIKAHRNLRIEKNNIVLYISYENNKTLYKNCIEYTSIALLSLGKEGKNYIDHVYYT